MSHNDITRRDFNQALIAAGLFGLFGDDDEPENEGSAKLGNVSFFDGFGVAQDGEEIEKGPDWLDFIGAEVVPTAKGVEIQFDPSSGGLWKENADGKLAPTNEQPVHTDEQTVHSSFTDPAGVEHTGELADIDDIGGGSGESSVEQSLGQHDPPIATVATSPDDINFINTTVEIDGTLKCYYRSSPTHVANTDSVVSVSESMDGGLTWTDPTTVFSAGEDRHNISGGITPDDSIILFWDRRQDDGTKTRMEFVRSTDGGGTWSSPTEIDTRGYTRFGPFGRVHELSDGTLIQGVWGWDSEGNGPGELWLISSTDDGQTWSSYATVHSAGSGETSYWEGSFVELDNEEMVCIARKNDGDQDEYHQFSSTDLGSTWSDDGDLSIWSTGNEVSPVLFRDGDTVYCIGSHRNHYGWAVDGDTNVGFLSLMEADASAVVGDEKAWATSIVFLNRGGDAATAPIESYPDIVDSSDGTLLVFSYNLTDTVNLAAVSTDTLKSLSAGNNIIQRHGDGFQRRSHPFVVDSGFETVFTDTSGSDSEQIADLSDEYPDSDMIDFRVGIVPDDSSNSPYINIGHPGIDPWGTVFRVPSDAGDEWEMNIRTPHDNGRVKFKTTNIAEVEFRRNGFE